MMELDLVRFPVSNLCDSSSSSLVLANRVHLQNYKHTKSFAPFKCESNQILILLEVTCRHSLYDFFPFLCEHPPPRVMGWGSVHSFLLAQHIDLSP